MIGNLDKAFRIFNPRDFLSGIAICTLALATIALIPFARIVLPMFVPLPILYYYTKLGRGWGTLMFAVSLGSFAILLRTFDAVTDLPLFLLLGLTGIFLAEMFRRETTIERTILLPSIFLLAAGVASVWIAAAMSGRDFLPLIQTYVEQTLRETNRIYAQMGLTPEQMQVSGEMAKAILMILPSLITAMVVQAIWINVLAAREIFRRNALPFPDFGDLSRWKAHERIVWLLIAAGIAVLVPVSPLRAAGWNLLILCLLVYMMQGLSIVSFYLKWYKIPRFLRFLTYIVILIYQFVLIVVAAIGLFDLWLDVRRFARPKEENSEG
jgi:uncharacterized protein YybS (DUF2232 family)